MREKTKTNLTIFLILVQTILAPAVLLSIILVMPNSEWRGFGIDSADNVYIGKHGNIQCFHNGAFQYSFPIPKFKAYSFTIQPDDTLLIAEPDFSHVYDLNGNLLSTSEINSTAIFQNLKYRTTFQAPDGSEYQCVNVLGFRRIYKNNCELLYQTPFAEYLLHFLSYFAFIIFFAIIIIKLIMYLPESNSINRKFS